MWLVRFLLMVCCGGLAGCAGMLPRGSADLASQFDSFESARQALESLTPYQSTLADMRAAGYAVDDSTNVTLIPYPQLVAHLSPNQSVPFEALDAGLRDCILARQACRAYLFRFGKEFRRRTGTFLLDFLNFERTTHWTGWRFEGLVVVRDDVVLFRNYGGEPHVDRAERQINPLGPLQQAGEVASSLVRR